MHFRVSLYILTLCFPFILIQAQSNLPKKFKLPDELREASGLYYVSSDSLWWHNDSGDQPRILLTDVKGNLKNQIFINGKNQDWEDLTADNKGNIYMGDFGNNQNQRQNLCIYKYNIQTKQLDSILFSYPDQQAFPPPPEQANFDMEAFFWHKDTLHLFSKNRLLKGNYYTKHYILPAQAGNFIAELRDSIYLKKRVVTAAAIAPDGQTFALLTYYFKVCLGFIPISKTTVYTFQNSSGFPTFNENSQKKRVGKFLIPTQYECLDFIDNKTVYIASERTPLYKQKAKRVKLKLPKIKPVSP